MKLINYNRSILSLWLFQAYITSFRLFHSKPFIISHYSYSYEAHDTSSQGISTSLYNSFNKAVVIDQTKPFDDSEDNETSNSHISIQKAINLLEAGNLPVLRATMFVEAILLHGNRATLPDRVYQKLIGACIQYGLIQHSIKVYNKAVDHNIKVNAHTITKLLSFLCVSGYYQESLALFNDAIAKGLEPAIHNFSPLLKHCTNPKDAMFLLMRMESFGKDFIASF